MTRPFAGTLIACTVAVALGSAAVVAVTGGGRHWTLEDARRARAADGRLLAPSAVLRDGAGDAVTFAPRGTVQVVDFIYTSCPTVCLSLGTAFQRMQHVIRVSPDPAVREVRLLSVSIDPERDDATALAAWAGRHRADAATWRVAAPTSPDASSALLRALGVVVVADGAGGFVHNASLHVIDARGRVRALHGLDDAEAALADAARLVREAP